MSNAFDGVKMYNSEWTEVNCRLFTPEEKSAVVAVAVVASKYGKSAAFMFANGRKFIPLEPNTTANVGDVLDINTIKLVELKYTGSNEEQKNRGLLRIRVEAHHEEQTFNNPFGLLCINKKEGLGIKPNLSLF